MSSSAPSLKGFKALSFDCYGTIIDWETGLLQALNPLTTHLPPTHKYTLSPPLLLQRLHTLSDALEQSHPTMPYPTNLSESLRQLSTEEGIALPEETLQSFGHAPGTWAPFPDSVDALLRLAKHYKLFILSNIDAENISRTVEKLSPARFAGVYTAEEIQSYKPAHANFRYLFDKVGGQGVEVGKGELLHVARSLTADHVPAKELGLRSVWISRGGERKEGEGVGGDLGELEGRVGFEWRFDDLGKFADEVERQFGE